MPAVAPGAVQAYVRPSNFRRGSTVNAGLLRRTPGIVRWNLGLAMLTLLLLGSSFVFRLRGGAENPTLDAAQVLVSWGYILVTPVLGALTWRAR